MFSSRGRKASVAAGSWTITTRASGPLFSGKMESAPIAWPMAVKSQKAKIQIQHGSQSSNSKPLPGTAELEIGGWKGLGILSVITRASAARFLTRPEVDVTTSMDVNQQKAASAER